MKRRRRRLLPAALLRPAGLPRLGRVVVAVLSPLLPGLLALSSCRCADAPAAVDAGVVVDDLTTTLSPEQEQNAIALVQARIPQQGGACAQVRSYKDKAEAEAAAVAIRTETRLPVALIEKDLGERGVWTRVCVGDEESPARVTARATRWTSPGGVLEKFLDAPQPDQAHGKGPSSGGGNEPRFFVLEKPRSETRTPSLEQAKALLRRSPGGPVVFAGPFDRPLLAATGPAPQSAGRVVVVDGAGQLLPLDPSPPPGCASCAVAEQKSPITARRVVAAGDLLPSPGDELLVEEETGDGTRFLAVVVDEGGTLKRKGAVLLAAASAGVILRGEASVVEADADDDREVAIARLELRTAGGNLCSLDTRAEAWGTVSSSSALSSPSSPPNPAPPAPGASARGLVKLDVLQLASRPEGDDAVVDFITALDGAGDRATGSRACARVLADRPGPLVSQLCLQRVRALVAEERLVDAVNAAGTLAEGTPALRAAVAAPFFQAMSALDRDPRLSAAPWDCATEPLVKDMPQKSIDDVLLQARARQRERVGLADVDDAVFVTATRDFGPETPVGQIAARWLERLRVSQPARHAAIEALLLPQAPAPDVVDAGAPDVPGSGGDGAPGFGGGTP